MAGDAAVTINAIRQGLSDPPQVQREHIAFGTLSHRRGSRVHTRYGRSRTSRTAERQDIRNDRTRLSHPWLTPGP